MDNIVTDYDFLKSGLNIPLLAYFTARFVKGALLVIDSVNLNNKQELGPWDTSLVQCSFLVGYPSAYWDMHIFTR